MRVWRICKKSRAATAFTGEGARLYGGRWSHPGTAVVYTSDSRALAALEVLVHLHRNQLPPGFISFAVEIPDDVQIEGIQVEDLPEDWYSHPAPESLKEIGTDWAEARESVSLMVPSAVIQGENNILLNPAHPDFSRLVIGEPQPFEYDERLFASDKRRSKEKGPAGMSRRGRTKPRG